MSVARYSVGGHPRRAHHRRAPDVRPSTPRAVPRRPGGEPPARRGGRRRRPRRGHTRPGAADPLDDQRPRLPTRRRVPRDSHRRRAGPPRAPHRHARARRVLVGEPADRDGWPPANATVCQFAPHHAALERAVCAITHGGMGTTVKALDRGVPVCVVPFARDQAEVARRVQVARRSSLPQGYWQKCAQR